ETEIERKGHSLGQCLFQFETSEIRIVAELVMAAFRRFYHRVAVLCFLIECRNLDQVVRHHWRLREILRAIQELSASWCTGIPNAICGARFRAGNRAPPERFTCVAGDARRS